MLMRIQTEFILSYLAVASQQSVNMFQMSIFFYFDLTCGVIGDPEVNKIRFHMTTWAGISNAAWILKTNPVVSEIGVGYDGYLDSPPPSGARYNL